MSDQNFHHCPVCSGKMSFNSRYPHAVCLSCQDRAVDEQGRSLEFFNQSMSGGLQIQYVDDGAKRTSPVCYIDGLKCRAEEARFGGVVIQVVES
jgi:hypothetical protein